MKVCTVSLQSTVPYSQSAFHETPKLNKEGHEDFDIRTWREKATVNADDIVCIPAMGLKMSIDEAAKRLGIKIPGKGTSTYAKRFVSGQICVDDVGPQLGIKKQDLEVIKVFANLDGVRGSGKRGMRYFPFVPSWKTTATFHILDDIISKEIFEQTITEAGKLIGIGRFRPEKGGLFGRFKCTKFTWSNA